MSKFNKFFEFLSIKNVKEIKKTEILGFLDGNLDLLKQEPEFYKLYFSLAFQPRVFALLIDDIMPIFEKLIDLFTNYYSQNGEKNAYVKARFLLAVLDGVGMHYVSDPFTFPLDKTKELIKQML